ncbi:P1 family peptidase [Antarcticibacterium sp. 1MA-6-2]|uniref:P1 family peptidase n=1 Tax=Antarcticibacterium sp. 1MA-6-2 TaxID=2908210 RepID=UPI00210572B7|nr:P1 family peptidase [Antarcticibacterium sp. 1MA-6-2]
MKISYSLCFLLLLFYSYSFSQQRVRELGIEIGVIPTGKLNGITDVSGVKVGHVTLSKGDSVRTGVTAILPHSGKIFQQKVPAAVYVGNGFGKLAGSTQVAELGNLETLSDSHKHAECSYCNGCGDSVYLESGRK